MKNLRLVICLAFLMLLTENPIAGQTVHWQWAKGSSGTSIDEGMGIGVDGSGSVYISGFFQSATTTFGPYTFPKAGGGADIFLVKYDSLGNLLWAKSPRGTGTDYTYGMSTDTSGNTYLTGTFDGTLAFETDTIVSPQTNGFFLAKFDASGNILWAQTSNSIASASDLGQAVATDNTGNAFVTGSFYSPTFVLGSDTLHRIGQPGIFIAKYDAMGNVLWAKSPKGTGAADGKGIATDRWGNVYVTGYFNSPVLIFDTDTLVNTNPGFENVFLAKYDTWGNFVWAKASESTGANYGRHLATDNSGNCYITGSFSYGANIKFGNITLTNFYSTNSDAFLVKYDSTGKVLWAKGAGGYSNDIGYNVLCDPSGNVYMSGGFSYQSIYDTYFDTVKVSFPAGSTDPSFIAKYDPQGVLLCVFALPSGGDDVLAITMDKAGTMYMCGDYMTDPFILGNDTLPLSCQEDVFAAKFTLDCKGITSITDLNTGEDISVYPNPATGHLFIKTNGIPVTEINIYNITGALLMKVQSPDVNDALSIELLPAGLYVAEIMLKETSVRKRWIKM